MYHFESVVTDGDVGDVADVLAHDLGLLATVRPNSLHARAKQFKSPCRASSVCAARAVLSAHNIFLINAFRTSSLIVDVQG